MEPSSEFDRIPSPRIVDDVRRPTPLRQVTKERRLMRLATLEDSLKRFTPGERLLLYFFTLILAVSTLLLVIGVNRSISVVVPSSGGALSEGETSPARFINPILAISQADKDVTMLVFSGLTRATPAGSFIPDLAA